MSPIELIHALERKRAALKTDIETLDEVITALKRTRLETIQTIEGVMESEFTHGWQALKRYLCMGDDAK